MRNFLPSQPIITIETVLSWHPCKAYPEKKIREIVGDGLTALQIANLEDISVEDRIWVLCHIETLGEYLLHKFLIACAEHVLSDDCDPRSRAAIETKQRWLVDEATTFDLLAARSDAWSAAESVAELASLATWSVVSAAESAAWSTSRTAELAAWPTAWAAMSAARSAVKLDAEPTAWAAEKKYQLDWIKNALKLG